MKEALPPIFVGGTGRSGTTILARLLGRHRDYTVIPVEAKFHCSPEGLPSVLTGRQAPERFAERMIEEWFHPPGGDERLAAFLARDALEDALARFVALAGEDLLAAGRSLMEELFGGYARSQGRRGWVEMTPINAMWGAPYLIELFPELRFVNVIRDGRDVAGSLIHLGRLANGAEALAWWEERMSRGHRQLASLPAESLLTVRFERLLIDDREGGLRELLSFMGWEEDDAMRRFFSRRMPPEETHVGRWQTDFSGDEREFVASEYEAILDRLRAAGVPLSHTSRLNAMSSSDADRSTTAVAGEAHRTLRGPAPQGLLEAVIDGRAYGWAHDPSSPGRRLELAILIDGELIAETVADLPRPSLTAEGIGDGRHGFLVELPPRLCDSTAHTISINHTTGEPLAIAAGFSSSAPNAAEWAHTVFTAPDPNRPVEPDADAAAARPRTLRLRPCDQIHLPRRARRDGFTTRDGPETIVLAPETVVDLPELRFAVQPGVADPLAERRMRNAAARSYAVPPLMISRLPNAIVDTDAFLIMPDEHRYLVDSLRHTGPLLRWGYQRFEHGVLQREAQDIPERAERVVVLGAQSNSNYSHWLVESLVRALLFGPLDDGTRHFLTPPLLDWQRETFELIGVDSKRVLELPRQGPVRFREVIAVSRGMGPMPALRPGGVAALANLATAPSSRRRRIHCSREAMRYRHVANDGDMAELLERHGFESVCTEQLSIREQIELFAAAEAVLAMHGSALTNIVFSPPGTPVIELQAEQFNAGGIPWNWILASLRNHPFAQVVCPLADTLHDLPHARRDVTVDTRHLDELLRSVLAS